MERKTMDSLIGCLNEQVRDDTIAKAAFLAGYDDPESVFDAETGGFRDFVKSGFGVLVSFENRDEMDRASVEVTLSAAGYEPLLADKTVSVQKACGRTLSAWPEHHSLELYEDAVKHFRQSYANVVSADNDLAQKQAELQRCSAALRSLREEDSWLNRENSRRVKKIQDCEKQAIAHKEAKRLAEEKMNAFDEQLTDANEKLPKELAELEAADSRCAALREEIAVLEKKNTFFGSLFRNDRAEVRAELAVKKDELEKLQKKCESGLEDTQKLKIEIERLTENVRMHRTEAARMDSKFAQAKDDLIRARRDYNDGERRFALSQDRIKETKKKLSTLEKTVTDLEDRDRLAREDSLMSARRVLMAFTVSSASYRKNLKRIAEMKTPEGIPAAVFDTVMFMAPAVFADWSEAESFFSQRCEGRPGRMIAYGTTYDRDRFERVTEFA